MAYLFWLRLRRTSGLAAYGYYVNALFLLLLVAGCIHSRSGPSGKIHRKYNQTVSKNTTIPHPPAVEQIKGSNYVLPPEEAPEYRIGIPDELKITVWKEPGLTTKTNVRPDGKISFPLIGDVVANGLTVEELRSEITRSLEEYIITPIVNVNISKIMSRRVIVLGAVKNPSVIQLTHQLSVLEAITKAGGLLTDELIGGEVADLDSAYITRNNKILDIDFKRLIRESDMSQNIFLQKGDVINIPSSISPGSEVYVFGEVRNPGAISLKKGTRVFEAIARAGGFNADETANYIKVVRGNLKSPEVINVNIDKFYDGDVKENILLRHHDVVYVTSTAVTKYARFMSKILTGVNTFYLLGSGIISADQAFKILKNIH